jgi:hypothetical protein
MSHQTGGQLGFDEKGQRLVDQIGHQLGDQLEILNKASNLLTNWNCLKFLKEYFGNTCCKANIIDRHQQTGGSVFLPV